MMVGLAWSRWWWLVLGRQLASMEASTSFFPIPQ